MTTMTTCDRCAALTRRLEELEGTIDILRWVLKRLCRHVEADRLARLLEPDPGDEAEAGEA